jgi:hypothetical protein
MPIEIKSGPLDDPRVIGLLAIHAILPNELVRHPVAPHHGEKPGLYSTMPP